MSGINQTVAMVLNLNDESRDLRDKMAFPTVENLLITVPKSEDVEERTLRAKLYLPPDLRKDEFIEFPLVLHV